jgi:hypothetical protein
MWGKTRTLNAIIALLGCVDDTIRLIFQLFHEFGLANFILHRNLAVIFVKAMSIYDFPRSYDLIPANRLITDAKL